MGLHLMVTGMHLSPDFGLTIGDIQADGFHIGERIETLLSSDTPEGERCKSAPTKSNVTALWTRDPAIYDRYVQCMDSVGIVVENRPLMLPED